MPRILILGEDPSRVDFSAPGAPPGMTAQIVIDGLTGSRDPLRERGFDAEILLTGELDTLEDQVTKALRAQSNDVIVIGAGLRTLPPMAEKFERLINIIVRESPHSRLAFNSKPDDSDIAALRWL